MRVVIWVLLIVFVLLVIACAPQQATEYPEVRQSSINLVASMAKSGASLVAENGPEKVKALAMEAVRDSLRDPASAQFRNVRLVKFSGGQVVCGEVNGKNAYGGYVGYKQWVSAGVYALLYEKAPIDVRHIEGSEYLERDMNAGLTAACS